MFKSSGDGTFIHGSRLGVSLCRMIDAIDEVWGEVGSVCSFDSLWVCLIVLFLT